jgi:arabinan endo-1,5-alpha-L-arabinosidase
MHVEAGPFERIYDPSVGESERWYVNDHTFVRDHLGTWHLIGITHAEPANPFDEKHLAHATAPSLHGPFTKQPFALSASAGWGETVLWAPHVIFSGGLFWMFVCAGGRRPDENRLHLATSQDCAHWERHPANPLVVDGYQARDPMVLRVGGRWVMYYTATSEPGGGNHVVVATESQDLVHWSGRRIVYTDAMVGTEAGPTESPFVVERGGRFYLFIGPDWEGLVRSKERTGRWDWRCYRGTRVLESDDPFRFTLAGQVGFLDTHASEVIVDELGAAWVSHCGWGQKGVYLAPLRWR